MDKKNYNIEKCSNSTAHEQKIRTEMRSEVDKVENLRLPANNFTELQAELLVR